MNSLLTVYSCAVINFLSSQEAVSGPVVFLYCNRADSERRDPTNLMQALVKQLSIFQSGLPQSIVQEYDRRIERGSGTLDFLESKDFVLSLGSLYPQTTIVIDALDESDPDERPKLLRALKSILQASTTLVKILISSRDDLDIKLELEQVPNLYIKALDNSGDIDRFVRREVVRNIAENHSLRNNVTDEFKERIISTIQEKADGMFVTRTIKIVSTFTHS